MAASYDTQDDWVGAVRQRRTALLQRLAMGCAAALVFSPIIGWDLATVWAVGYFAVQIVDLWVFGPINSGRAATLGPLRKLVAHLMLFANSAAFGSLSIPLWVQGGAMGGVFWNSNPGSYTGMPFIRRPAGFSWTMRPSRSRGRLNSLRYSWSSHDSTCSDQVPSR